MTTDYVHGYQETEAQRLRDQAQSLTDLLHGDTRYPAGAAVLEAGCGVGAQTVTLLSNSPEARFTAIDLSPGSLEEARRAAEALGTGAVAFLVADIFALPFAEATFDHAFVCFVLEHLADPVKALGALRRVIRPGGSLTVIEGDHGSAYFHPDSAFARQAIACQVALQAEAGGDAMIGRRLYPAADRGGLSRTRASRRARSMSTEAGRT